MNEQAGRTPREDIRKLNRREQIAGTRALHRQMSRRHRYARMLAAGLVTNIALAWTLMITVGVLHASWWHVVPTMGYHTASLVTGFLLIGVITSIVIVQTARDSS